MNKELYYITTPTFLPKLKTTFKPKQLEGTNYVYVPKQLSKKQAIVLLIRRKYDTNDELAIQRRRDERPEEFTEYNSYVKTCIQEAENFIKELEAWERLE